MYIYIYNVTIKNTYDICIDIPQKLNLFNKITI